MDPTTKTQPPRSASVSQSSHWLPHSSIVPSSFGSRSTPDMIPQIRRVGATAREALIDLAAKAFPKPLIRGVQITVGLLFLKIAWDLVSNPPSSFAAPGRERHVAHRVHIAAARPVLDRQVADPQDIAVIPADAGTQAFNQYPWVKSGSRLSSG